VRLSSYQNKNKKKRKKKKKLYKIKLIKWDFKEVVVVVVA